MNSAYLVAGVLIHGKRFRRGLRVLKFASVRRVVSRKSMRVRKNLKFK